MGIRSLLRNAFGRNRTAERDEPSLPQQSAGPDNTAAAAAVSDEATNTVVVPAQPTAETADRAVETVIEPVAEPVAERVAEPVTERLAEPVAERAVEPAAKPVVERVVEPVGKQATEPVAERLLGHAAEPVTEPIGERVAEPAVEPVTEPTAERIAEPASERLDEPAAERVTEPVAERAAEPVAERVDGQATEPVAERLVEPATEPATEPVTDPAVEPVAQPAAERIAEPVTEPSTEPTAERVPDPGPLGPIPTPGPHRPEPVPQPEPEPTPMPSPKPIPEPEPVPTPEPHPVPEPAPGPDPEPAPAMSVTAPAAAVVAPAGSADAPAVSLEKVRATAPALVSLYKSAGVSLRKQGLAGQRAAVYLVLDRSGSMRRYYKDGTVQHLAEQALGLAAHLDDDGVVPVVFFSTDIDGTAEIDLANHSGRIQELHESYGHMGRTNYHWAIEAVIDHYSKSGSTDPAFVIFQTDGAPYSKSAAEKALCDAAKLPIFWQFVGFGDPEGKGFDFLRKLDDLPVPERRVVDNAGFFHAGREPKALSDDTLYAELMVEFPEWLAEARAAGIVR